MWLLNPQTVVSKTSPSELFIDEDQKIQMREEILDGDLFQVQEGIFHYGRNDDMEIDHFEDEEVLYSQFSISP